MEAQSLTKSNPTLRDELGRFFADQIRSQKNINSSLQALTQVVAHGALLTAPMPHLSASAFGMLYRLALVRLCLLQPQAGLLGAGPTLTLGDVRQLVLGDQQCLAQSPLGLSYAALSGALADLSAADPANGGLDGQAQRGQAYLDAVRDQLLALTRLEMDVMRFVHDAVPGTEPNSSCGEL